MKQECESMIKEQYVSFEVSKLLKEKNFNEEVRTYYDEFGKERDLFDDFSDIKNTDIDAYPEFADSLDLYCTRPTQQMVMRWLREVHNIHISITFGWVSGYNAQVDWAEESEKGNDKPACCVWRTDLNTTYEVAVEAAIKYCLENLVK